METSADPARAREKSSASWSAFVLWPLAGLFLYVFSAGPVELLYDKGYLRSRAAQKSLDIVYAPLIWADRYTLLHKPLDAYLDLWRPRPNPSPTKGK